MNHVSLVLLAISAPLLGMADAGPGGPQCTMLNKIGAMAAAETTRSAALGVLEQIAKGDNQNIAADWEQQLGLTPADLHHPVYGNVVVRACALRSLGRTGLTEATDFLRNFSLSDAAGDKSQTLWPAAQIALREALLSGITDAGSRAAFLENVLKEPHDAMSNSSVTHWAVDDLCDSGYSEALPRVRQSIKNRRNGQRDDDEIAFCEARMQIVARDPDRARALGSVFGSIASLESTPEGKRLIQRATLQLIPLHSPSADAELERIAGDLAVQAKSFPKDAELADTKKFIDAILAARRK
jgi:hypothetical protein